MHCQSPLRRASRPGNTGQHCPRSVNLNLRSSPIRTEKARIRPMILIAIRKVIQ